MRLLAIDPGTEKSAFCLYDDGEIMGLDIEENNVLIGLIGYYNYDVLAIEQIRSYGMPIGATTLDTVNWCGRFHQESEHYFGGNIEVVYIPRKEVIIPLCGHPKAKDANVRQALIDVYGEPRIPKIQYKAVKNGRTSKKFLLREDAEAYINDHPDCVIVEDDSKSIPNPAYAVKGGLIPSKDMWSALAVAHIVYAKMRDGWTDRKDTLCRSEGAFL